MPIMKLNVLIMKLYVQPISAFSCSIGSLASCRDPEIILEILNFLLCSEVFLIFTWHWIISLFSLCTESVCILFQQNVRRVICAWKFQVRSQDCVHGLAVSLEGRETAWKWLQVSTPFPRNFALHSSSYFFYY